jgi:hypothetical protein
MERVCAILTTSKLLPARSDNHREGKAWVKTQPCHSETYGQNGSAFCLPAWPGLLRMTVTSPFQVWQMSRLTSLVLAKVLIRHDKQ